MPSSDLQTLTFASPEQPFKLLAGGSLSEVTIAYETWGKLSPGRDNAVLITTGLSASSHVARHGADGEDGWWDRMVGPGRPIDTDRLFVICTNVLGGCFGSTGAASIDPATGRPYGPAFPVLNVEDMVDAQFRVVEHLGIRRLVTVMGASLGGMLALQWGARYPDRVASVVGIATPGRSYAFSIAWRAVQRWVVMNDPRFRNGRYEPGHGPVEALNTARAIGILSYRSPAEFDQRFGRDLADGDPVLGTGQFAVESYLAHNAGKFGTRFDANCYLSLARAMDLFDLGRGAGSYEEGVGRITSPSLVVGFSSDMLFPVEQQREIHAILQARGRPTRYEEFDTIHGHDAFLIEVEALGEKLVDFLAGVPRSA